MAWVENIPDSSISADRFAYNGGCELPMHTVNPEIPFTAGSSELAIQFAAVRPPLHSINHNL